MADTGATPSSNPSVRLLTGLGAASAGQEVTTVADSAGNLLGTTAAPFPVTGSGTAGTPATGVQTIQGIASGTAVAVSLAANTPTLAAGTATVGGVLNPSATRTTQTISSVAAGAAVAVAGYQSVLVTFTPTAVSAFSTTFQISDDGGTTWYTTTGRQMTSTNQTIATAYATTAAAAWQVTVVGATHFRLNTTSFTGTSMAVGITPTAAPPSIGTGITTQLVAASSGGASKFRLNSAATTNATSVKAGGGSVYGWIITNTNAAARMVKLYDLATAPTVGTSVPAVTISCPAAGATTGTVATNFPIPIPFPTGIALATTTLATDADATAVAAGDLLITLIYV